MTAPKPKLRRFQFSLRTLLLFVTLCAIACSWFAVKMQPYWRQRKAVAEIKKLGGNVYWSSEEETPWLWDDYVFRVDLNGTHITDAGLQHLAELSQLSGLNVEGTQVTDVGLEHLEEMSHLDWLRLSGTKVTNEGVKKLQKALPNCEIVR